MRRMLLREVTTRNQQCIVGCPTCGRSGYSKTDGEKGPLADALITFDDPSDQISRRLDNLQHSFRRIARLTSIALIACMMVNVAPAGDDRQKKSDERSRDEKPRRQMVLYNLDFTLDGTLDGKPSAPRNFKILMQEGETNRVRIGSKILLSAGESEPKFADVGLKFDCRLNERDGYVALDGKLELNELASPATNPPTIHNFQAEIETAVLPDKATTIGVYDDPVSKRRYELRVLVTKAK